MTSPRTLDALRSRRDIRHARSSPDSLNRSSSALLIAVLLTAILAFVAVLPAAASAAFAEDGVSKVAPQGTPPPAGPDLDIEKATVRYHDDLDLLVFEVDVVGVAGRTVPEPRGSMDGAPVLGYVFPTTLEPRSVGFSGGEGVVALAVTAHPDFDDTPLWDENRNRRYDDDGVVFHTHWVVLVPDQRVAGGLAVAEIGESQIAEILPPTNPGMPMLLDSPGYSVVLRGDTLKVLVPAARLYGEPDFRYDAVTAYMEVGPGADRPLLGVYQVYEVLSGDLSLPYRIERE
ncbi:MAG: hypothetical protein DWQ36_12660 [Acidobacteria bacterium]|nr:MAG: hypothetical protein DWQ30_13040 [Acidobacteriota bacterium]REK07390.1 MAG: hypothetical protein DWQ36_12660 [Acidobacteriota bacterium]